MHEFDLVSGVILLFTLIRGLMRGFITEIFSIAAIAFSLFLATMFNQRLAGIINSYYATSMASIIAFLSIFILCYILIKLLQDFFSTSIMRLNLQSLDKALGLFAGIVKGVMLIVALLTIIVIQPFGWLKDLIEGSISLQLCSPLLHFFTNIIQGWLENV